VRIFGEVVALLCADAQHDAAVRLEELWNELVRKHRLSLFCAYPIDAFSREAHGAPFRRVCEEHAHVIPAESFTTLKSPVERLRAVSRLQQQVRALQTEAGERERAEESLRRTQAELSDFLDNAVEGMQRIAPDGRVLWANDPLLGLLGYTVAEYVGRRAAEFHASSEQYDALWRRLMHGETLCDYPADLRCGNGSIKRVLVHANARWDNGQFLYARCYIRDVTARRESSVEPGRSQ
jgi:PAS domain S-box-containing protein